MAFKPNFQSSLLFLDLLELFFELLDFLLNLFDLAWNFGRGRSALRR